jgi:hypothetical protein
MKTTVVALSCLTGIVVSFAAGSAGGGKSTAPSPGVQSVGVVRVVSLLLRLSEAGKLGEAVKADQGKARQNWPFGRRSKRKQADHLSPRAMII